MGGLLAHRLRQELERLEWDEAYVDHGLVFADVDGNPIRPDFVTERYTNWRLQRVCAT